MKKLGLMVMYMMVGCGICAMLCNSKIDVHYDNSQPLTRTNEETVNVTNTILWTNKVEVEEWHFETNSLIPDSIITNGSFWEKLGNESIMSNPPVSIHDRNAL